jgi:hypothetical protein
MLTMVAFSLLVFVLAATGASNDRDRDLNARAEEIAQAVPRAELGIESAGIQLVPVESTQSSEMFVLVLDSNGRPLVSGGVVDGQAPSIAPDILSEAQQRGGALATLDGTLRVAVRQVENGWLPRCAQSARCNHSWLDCAASWCFRGS